MKGILFTAVAVLLIGVGAYFFWTVRPDLAPFAGRATVAEELPILEPAEPMRPDIFMLGTVVPVQQTTASTGASGKVVEILVREGDTVEAGQVLVRLDNGLQQVALAKAEAALREKQAELDKLTAGVRPQEITVAETAVEIAEAKLARITDATPNLDTSALDMEVSHTVAEAELRRAQAELELLEAGARAEDIAAAEAAVASAEADLQQRQLELAATEVRSPFAGTVASVDLDLGQFIAAWVPVIQIADLSAWQIASSAVDELSIVAIEIGDEARITFDAIPDLELTGKLTHIQPMGNVNNGAVTYSILIAPEQRDPRVRWNMTAQIQFSPQESQ